MLNFKKVLILSPHTDDAELGCGGFISKLKSEGCELFYVAFSDCEKSLPPGFSSKTLSKECLKSTSKIGIKKKNVSILNYPVRTFDKYRQEILENLIELKNKISPDLILTPCSNDIHQDHIVIYNETLRAFKKNTILGYELPWNCLKTNSTLHVSLSSKNVVKKVDSLKCYVSQKNKFYFDEKFIINQMKFNGKFVNEDYAEKFEPIKIYLE